jgi:hypothetical protein
MSTSSSSSGGIGLGGVLFVVFLVLKLTHVISWSWWWVTSPLWISFALFFVILGIMGLFASIALLIGIALKK